jgi:hypothetical protein
MSRETLAQHFVFDVISWRRPAAAEIAADIERNIIERKFKGLAFVAIGPLHDPGVRGPFDIEALRNPTVAIGGHMGAQLPQMLQQKKPQRVMLVHLHGSG